MQQRFLKNTEIISEILRNCELLRSLQEQFPFIDCDNKDFVTLVNLFDKIVIQDYPDDSLIICIGDSPAKCRCAIKNEIVAKKCQAILLSGFQNGATYASKTILPGHGRL